MATHSFAEILAMVNRKDLAEVGGAHNQKGIEFQRYWAIMRMIELEEGKAEDFLLLFETIQDVAILDSSSTPTTICIYQVKKKDRKEWKWTELTALGQPKPSRRNSSRKKSKSLSTVQNSPIGKLYASIIAFKGLKSSGRFVSNAGCDLPLKNGTSGATSLPYALSMLDTDHRDLLSKGLEAIQNPGEPAPDLSSIYMERVHIPVDDPGTYIIGLAHKFLELRSARHAGQARALIESLLAKVGPLGARTDTCGTFAELRQQRGYSKSEFTEALSSLEEVPDLLEHLETWLSQLSREGMSFMKIVSIRAAAASIFTQQVMGNRSREEELLILQCKEWLSTHTIPARLMNFIEEASNYLQTKNPSFRESEVMAHFSLQAVKQCVAQI